MSRKASIGLASGEASTKVLGFIPRGEASKARPSAKFVVAVWGEQHINRFERYALASILAPGNLPMLAHEVDVEFVILTSERDISYFKSRELMRQVARYAQARYIPIDDLIVPGATAVTLTLALTRGIVAFGPQQTRHHFIFWSADVVMSDGTLAALAGHIVADRKVILAGSYRSVAEELEPRLDLNFRRDQGILSVQSRALVDLALRHPHMASIARTVNQPHVRTLAPTQLFWSDFAETVVAHFFQIFMLSIKPTRAIGQINSYCHYSFIPELCPNEPLYIVDDSDEMFLLELQKRDREQELLGFDSNSVEKLIPSYSEWSTPEQRQSGRVPVVLHTRDTNERTAALKEQSAAFVAELENGSPPPTSHVGHRYWVWGVTSWLEKRREAGYQAPPPELDLTLDVGYLKNPSNLEDARRRNQLSRPLASSLRSVARRLIGRVPRLSPLHPQHASYAIIVPEIDRLKGRLADDPQFRLLVAAPIGSWVDEEFLWTDPRIFRVEPRHLRFWSLSAAEPVDAAFLLVEYPDDPAFIDLLMSVRSAVAMQGEIVLAQRKPIQVKDPAWVVRGRLGALTFTQSLALGVQPEITYASAGDVQLAEATEVFLGTLRYSGMIRALRFLPRLLRALWRAQMRSTSPLDEGLDPPVQIVRLRLHSVARELNGRPPEAAPRVACP